MPPEQTSPTIEIVGLYSLSSDADRCSRFIQEEIAQRDPANLSEVDKATLRRLGREDAIQPFAAEERAQMAMELHELLSDVTVFEVLVSNPDENFDVSAFVQPNPAQSDGSWQVAWNEKFLSADGETLLETGRRRKVPDVAQFRIAFTIHFWSPDLPPLRSSYGELSAPSIQPLPERLWRLAPYESG